MNFLRVMTYNYGTTLWIYCMSYKGLHLYYVTIISVHYFFVYKKHHYTDNLMVSSSSSHNSSLSIIPVGQDNSTVPHLSLQYHL